MSQGDGKSMQPKYKDLNKVIARKEEEISRLRDHNQKLLLQIKKEKDKVQCSQKLEENIQAFQQKILGKGKENFSSKKVN